MIEDNTRAFAFFIARGSEVFNETSTCTLNSLLRAFINSDKISDTIKTRIPKTGLVRYKDNLFEYLDKKKIDSGAWIAEIYGALVKYFHKELPETFRTRIQFLIHLNEYRYLMRPSPNMTLDQQFHNYEDYLHEFYERAMIHRQYTEKELEEVNSMCSMSYDHFFGRVGGDYTYFPIPIGTAEEMWSKIKTRLIGESDVFIYVSAKYVHDPMPI